MSARLKTPLAALFAASIPALALAGCAVGPDYKAPAPPKSASAAFLGTARPGPGISTAAPDQTWWKLYDDPVLNGLVADALQANTDLRVALAHVEKARAALRGSRADRLPQTGIDASGGYGEVARSQTLPGYDRTGRRSDGELSVNYEVDLFGRVRREIEASHADLAAAREDADAMRVTVVADTVRAYLDAASTAQQIAVARDTLDLLDRSRRITQARYERGLTQKLDVIRIDQLREEQAATIPTLEAQRQAALFRLATLTGRTPAQLPPEAGARTATPQLSQPIPVGDGAALLARRPDVRAAERRLAADTARIGVATADLYPRITLGGSVGATTLGGGPLLGASALRWLVGPLISWAFPNQEAIRAKIGGARADADADLATFDGTVLTALQETETALFAYKAALLRQSSLDSARNAARRAEKVARARQDRGEIDALDVLDAQRTLARSEAADAQGRHDVAMAQVDLFRALGGSWQTHKSAGPSSHS